MDTILSFIDEYLLVSVAALISITFHEVSHGYMAYRLGDNTAKNLGRLSLNPIKHIDIFGLFMLIIAGFGWAKPVPINMNNFKNPKQGMAITALAGPVSNFILAFVSLFIISILHYADPFESISIISTTINFLAILVMLNIGLGMFNLIPIPPLDGSKILYSFLPNKVYYNILQYERYGFIVLMVLLYLNVFDSFLIFFRTSIFDFLWKIANTPVEFLYNLFFN